MLLFFLYLMGTRMTEAVIPTWLLQERSDSCLLLQSVTRSKDAERPQIGTRRFTLRIGLQK